MIITMGDRSGWNKNENAVNLLGLKSHGSKINFLQLRASSSIFFSISMGCGLGEVLKRVI